ncbi:MAG: hypothetical protein R2820_13630 [Cyclobacteriaceae bacterium]|nr:hypothetical protein [Cyclobacteriaceae bacterium]
MINFSQKSLNLAKNNMAYLKSFNKALSNLEMFMVEENGKLRLPRSAKPSLKPGFKVS